MRGQNVTAGQAQRSKPSDADEQGNNRYLQSLKVGQGRRAPDRAMLVRLESARDRAFFQGCRAHQRHRRSRCGQCEYL